MSELARIAADDETVLVNPSTGELVDVHDTQAVATFLADVRALVRFATEARKRAEELLAEHAREVGAKTFKLDDGRKITVSDNDNIDWDIDQLEKLLDAGLPEARWNELVTLTVTAKVNTSVARQLARSGNEQYRQIIEQAETRTPGRLYVKVEQ